MPTVIVTPLFPPDPSPAALYTKELAGRLVADDLSVVAYGSIPESVSGVPVYPLSKRSNKLRRVFACVTQLRRLQPKTIILQNGPSVELPVLLYSIFSSVKIIFVTSDQQAAQAGTRIQNIIRKKLSVRAEKNITLPDNPTTYLPIEWLPFGSSDSDAVEAHAFWWENHQKEFIL